MDPILAQKNDYFNKTLLTKKNAKLSYLNALLKPFATVLSLIYGGTAFIAFVTNISAVIILVKRMKTTADLRKYLINLSAADLLMAIFSVPFNYTDVMNGSATLPRGHYRADSTAQRHYRERPYRALLLPRATLPRLIFKIPNSNFI
jgi:hypothetical protein